jgi:hypothetical protein
MHRALLLPCPGCFRHVRVGSGACPFCGKGLRRSFGTSRAPLQPHRKTRAGAYSHTAAASLLAAAACGGLASSSNGDAGDAGDATPPDRDGGDATLGRDVAAMDAAVDALDGGGVELLDATPPCDSGPAEIADACGDARCAGGQCILFECRIRCAPAPPYGKAHIEE